MKQPLASGSVPSEPPSQDESGLAAPSPAASEPLEMLNWAGGNRRIPWRKTVALASVLGMSLTIAGCTDKPAPPPPDNNQVSVVQPATQSGDVPNGAVQPSIADNGDDEDDEDDVDDNDIFVYSGGHYFPYHSYTGSMASNSLVRRDNGTYVPYTGSKHPTSWTTNPGYVKPAKSASKPTTSSGVGTVTRKSTGGSSSSKPSTSTSGDSGNAIRSSGSSSSSFGSSGSTSSFGSSSSGSRSGSSSSGSSSSGG
ncbi:hypothetical protein GTO89_05875 [Heliobacterium gestii]|uniref:Uncharacterized protein n=1 Tax=Heliomicrobium gestii TaxID=2699 RepID=A0A845LB91_HELGE|nr:hypothetical protein [Heliomicrobium gestii]MBM7866109.1 hypothetical protein [Heliomicrobium gestii]MZP42564.1 hypothetical protein [Heliomicrobium gestii]